MKKLLILFTIAFGLNAMARDYDSLIILDTEVKKLKEPLKFCNHIGPEYENYMSDTVQNYCMSDILEQANSTSNQTLVERLLSSCHAMKPSRKGVATFVTGCYEQVYEYLNDSQLNQAIERANCKAPRFQYNFPKADRYTSCIDNAVREFVSKPNVGRQSGEEVLN